MNKQERWVDVQGGRLRVCVQGPEDAPALVVAASPGAGKSRITRRVLAREDLVSLRGDAVFYLPTLAMAKEAAADAASLKAAIGAVWGLTNSEPPRTSAYADTDLLVI